MTNKQIQEIYKKQRHAFAQRKYYYKKKYGIELKTPKIVKNPTEKTIERYSKEVYKQIEQVKKQKKVKRKPVKKNVPTAEEILLNRIREVVNTGLNSENSFEQYKADKINDLINESLPVDKNKRIQVLQEWEKQLPDIDKAIDTFIFDSEQTDTVTRNHTIVLWNRISSIMLGTQAVFIEGYDIEDDEI